jgi:hypothetical protein
MEAPQCRGEGCIDRPSEVAHQLAIIQVALENDQMGIGKLAAN